MEIVISGSYEQMSMAAAGQLKMIDYYQWVQSKLPGAPHSS